jgi:hypothetical protein
VPAKRHAGHAVEPPVMRPLSGCELFTGIQISKSVPNEVGQAETPDPGAGSKLGAP